MTLSLQPVTDETAAAATAFRACVVGLGKIGLALAAQYVSKGIPVVGVDINRDLIDLVNRGAVPPNSENGLPERVREGRDAGLLSATFDTARAVRDSNVVVVIVPLVVDSAGEPDFATLDSATRSIAEGLQPGTLVVYETTLPLGTTRTRFTLMLEQSGLRAGVDFFVAFSPERVYVGRTFEDLARYPKVIGGISRESTEHAVNFYRSVLDADVLVMPDADTAEFVKLAETTYRDVNIGLANDLARFAQSRGIDAVAAFNAANTQPFSNLHMPGVGVGGHCIPVYPRFLLAQASTLELPVVRAARHMNDSMAEYAVSVIADRLGMLEGKRILILGLAYRGGVKEPSFSSALLLIAALRARGARVLLHDPLFSADEIRTTGAEPVLSGTSLEIDAAILQTDHPDYLTLDWSQLKGCSVVIDGRNFLDPEPIKAAGIEWIGIGRGRND